MRKNYLNLGMAIIIIIVIVSMMISNYNNKNNDELQDINNPNNTYPENGTSEDLSTYNAPEVISKAQAIKMLALIKESKERIELREREINYEDTSIEDWYDKYFNVAIVEGWFLPKNNRINPMEALVYSDIRGFLTYLQIDEGILPINIGDKKDDDQVAYEDWIKVYEYILSFVESDSLLNETLYVFATPAVTSGLGSWQMATSKGIYGFEGLAIDHYLNGEIEVVTRGNEIIYIKNVNAQEWLTNAYVVNYNKEEKIATIFMGGISLDFNTALEEEPTRGSNFIADIQFQGQDIIQIVEKNNIVQGMVKKVTDEMIEIENYGRLKVTDDTKFYYEGDALSFKTSKSVIVGYDVSDIIIDEGYQVAAVVIKDEPQGNMIRVAISTSNFTSLIHPDLIVTCDNGYKITKGDVEETAEPGFHLTMENVNFNIGERLYIIPNDNGRIRITTIERGASSNLFNPEYRGIIEVEKVENGYIVVNELDLESYLYSVVPSEMPASYGVEALKVQAICARSYAYAGIMSNRYCDYGAHVDDSTASQVYNNIQETESSIMAVDSTKGEMLSYEGNIISANFFSTSCGVTADSGDVWADTATREFPTTSLSYLQSKYQNDETNMDYDLSIEEDFREFIISEDIVSFDDVFPWYRWEVSMSKEQIEASINNGIGTRYDIQPKLIKTLDQNNVFKSREVDGIGELVDLWVYSRGNSGIITEMIVEGTKGIYKIATEYNIRLLIAPNNRVEAGEAISVMKQDGNTVNNMGLMPSAFFTMDKVYDENGDLLTVIFYGGGYGHGVGMSQNGVKTMVDKGYDYEAILNHYYEGIEIKQVY